MSFVLRSFPQAKAVISRAGITNETFLPDTRIDPPLGSVVRPFRRQPEEIPSPGEYDVDRLLTKPSEERRKSGTGRDDQVSSFPLYKGSLWVFREGRGRWG